MYSAEHTYKNISYDLDHFIANTISSVHFTRTLDILLENFLLECDISHRGDLNEVAAFDDGVVERGVSDSVESSQRLIVRRELTLIYRDSYVDIAHAEIDGVRCNRKTMIINLCGGEFRCNSK